MRNKDRVLMIYDKDEFPVTVCENSKEGAKFLGTTVTNLLSRISRGKPCAKHLVKWVEVGGRQ